MRPLHRCPSAAVLLGLLAALLLSAVCRAQEPPIRPAKPTLRVLAIGVSQYKDSSLNLQFPAKDAGDIAARFQAQEGGLFGKVIVTTLTDKAATRDAILDSLVALRKKGPTMGSDDCTILYIDGHATIDDLGQYIFVPSDADPGHLDVTGIPWMSFSGTLAALPGRVLLLLDTCHAGGVSLPNGAFFAACAKGELTQESADWKQGAFAKALLEGLDGAADDDHNGTVTLAEVARYVGRRVSSLPKSAQNPILVKSGAFPADLALAAVIPRHVPPAQESPSLGRLEL